jgi:signal transduction histidine kinase
MIDSAKARLLNNIAVELSQPHAAREDWWRSVAGVLSAFSEAVNCRPIRLFTREGARYEEKVNSEAPVDSSGSLRVTRRHIYGLPQHQFVEVGPTGSWAELAGRLGIASQAWLYRHDTPTDPADESRRDAFSLLLLFPCRPSEFWADFCRIIALEGQASDLLFQSVDDQTELRKRVSEINHSTKTPLTLALFETGGVLGEIEDQPALADAAEHLEMVKHHIFTAKAQMARIHGEVTQPPENVDLRDILATLIGEFKPIADHGRLRVTRKMPAQPVGVRVVPDDLALALRNLFDNSYKYAFSNSEIIVSARMLAESRAELVIVNYGVGIPPEKLEAIAAEGERGLVDDPVRVRQRPGTGFGVPIALRILRGYGGTLEYESTPTSRTEKDTWLHCVTRTIVTMRTVESGK